MTIDVYIFIIFSIISVLLTGVFIIYLTRHLGTGKKINLFLPVLWACLVWFILHLLNSVGLFNENLTLIFWRVLFALPLIVLLFVFRFAYGFIYGKINRILGVIGGLFYCVILSVVLFTDKIVQSIEFIDGKYKTVYETGEWFVFIALVFVLAVIIITAILAIGYINATDKKTKKQLKSFLLGFFIAGSGGLVTNLFFPYFKTDFPELAHFFVAIMLLVYIKAIYEWEAFDIKMTHLSIAKKIYLVFFVVGMSMTILGASLFYFSAKDVLLKELFVKLSTITQSRKAHINTYLEKEQEKVEQFTNGAVLFIDFLQMSKTDEKYDEIFNRVQKRLVGIVDESMFEVNLVYKNGNIISSSNSQKIDTYINNQEYLKKEGQIVGINYSDIDNSFFEITSPFFDGSDFLGIFLVKIKTDKLFNIVTDKLGLGQTGEVYLVDKHHILLTPLSGVDYGFEKINVPELERCILGHKEYSDHSRVSVYKNHNKINVFGYPAHIIKENWCLIAEIDKKEVLSPINKLLYIALIAGLLIILIYHIMSKKLAENISQPINKLNLGVSIIESGNLDYDIEINSKDEIGDLSRAFFEMAKSIKKSRQEINKKVEQQTKEIIDNQKSLEDQQIAMLSVLEDIDMEKQKINHQLFETEKFRQAVENSAEQTVITDIDGSIVYANKATKKITGYELKEIIGANPRLWQSPMDKKYYEKMWHKIKIEKKPFEGLVKNRHKDGSMYDAAILIFPILNISGDILFFVGIERDVTHEQEIDRMKSEFISIASHQLRTPLSAIKWFMEMLINGDLGKMKGEQLEFVKKTYESAERMTDLVNDLLNVSRIESGSISIIPKPTDMIEMGNSIIEELKPLTVKRKQKIVFEKSKQKLDFLKIDPKLIRQVVVNLLSNASKYTQEKGKIILKYEIKKSDFVITVKDNGYGIPKHQQARIFSKFFRADNIVGKNTDGTGLGLYVVKQITEASGGRVWFKSEEKKGTEFYIALPLTGSHEKKGEKTLV